MDTNEPNPTVHQPTPHQPQSGQPTPEQQQKDQFDRRHFNVRVRHHDRWFGDFVWGVLVIMVGLAFLARSLGYVPDFDWHTFATHAWPVLIIFLGLSIISRAGIAARVISVIFMLLILAVFVLWLFRIPVSGHLGNRAYNFDPARVDNWLSTPLDR